MYLLHHNHSIELFRERQELLAREARDARPGSPYGPPGGEKTKGPRSA